MVYSVVLQDQTGPSQAPTQAPTQRPISLGLSMSHSDL